MNKRNIIVRIVAIALCALMILSVVAVALNAFAVDTSAAVLSAETGSTDAAKWVVLAIAVALIAMICCIVLPKLKKK